MIAGAPTPVIIGILIASVVALVYFSEKAVGKIVGLTHYFGFSASFVGLTIFSVATSLPEIFAHLSASIGIMRGTLDYAVASSTVVGANVGSDIFQQTIILAVAILFMGRVHFSRGFTLTAFIPMILAAMLTFVLALDGVLSRLDGAILLLMFILYTLMLYNSKSSRVKEDLTASKHPKEDALLATLYIVLMLVAAQFLLSATENLVVITGLGGSLIGALTLGVASASPELFTALTAARKKQTDVSLGVLIGSNITNPILALGLGAAISTYVVPVPTIRWDLPIKILSPLILFYFLHKSAPRGHRGNWLTPKGYLGTGAATYLIAAYVVFVLVRILVFSADFAL